MTLQDISDDALAIVLLTAVIGGSSRGGSVPAGPAPLGPAEYAKVATTLHERGSRPSELRIGEAQLSDEVALHAGIEPSRMRALLERTAAIGLLLDRVHTAGLWVLTRADAAYPRRMKRVLGNATPPMLYGVGAQELLGTDGGIGIVGSRDLDDAGSEFARQVGAGAARDKYVVVSGGAKGADEIGMRASLDSGGCAIAILGKDLAREATRSHWRQPIADGRCTLISTVSPWTGFNAGNLMARNKCIYAMCEAVFVAASDTKGGTWTGALENERHQWSHLVVRHDSDAPKGNQALISEHGALAITTAELSSLAVRTVVDQPLAAPNVEAGAEQLRLG